MLPTCLPILPLYCYVWVQDYSFQFSLCVSDYVVFQSLKEGDHLVWDKDDKSAMDFVASCANIRAHIFGIPQKSRFDIKCKYNRIHLAVITLPPSCADCHEIWEP
jgi:hypothetical protein